MNTCPVCGRTRLIPDERFWPYRYKEIYYCSENCWLCDIVSTKMKEGKKEMARIKKDGTPAKRPGPKKKPAPAEAVHGMQEAENEFSDQCDMDLLKDEAPTVMVDGPLRIETKEAENIEIVQTSTEPADDFDSKCTVTAFWVEGLGEFYYDKKYKSVDWRTEGGDEVSLGPAWWQQLAEDLPRILKKLGV
jgi:hypothetical protein